MAQLVEGEGFVVGIWLPQAIPMGTEIPTFPRHLPRPRHPRPRPSGSRWLAFSLRSIPVFGEETAVEFGGLLLYRIDPAGAVLDFFEPAGELLGAKSHDLSADGGPLAEGAGAGLGVVGTVARGGIGLGRRQTGDEGGGKGLVAGIKGRHGEIRMTGRDNRRYRR